MKPMKAKEFRELSSEDLTTKIQSLEENLLKLLCGKVVVPLEDTSVLSQSRKDIARAKTILKEKEIANSKTR